MRHLPLSPIERKPAIETEQKKANLKFLNIFVFSFPTACKKCIIESIMVIDVKESKVKHDSPTEVVVTEEDVKRAVDEFYRVAKENGNPIPDDPDTHKIWTDYHRGLLEDQAYSENGMNKLMRLMN